MSLKNSITCRWMDLLFVLAASNEYFPMRICGTDYKRCDTKLYGELNKWKTKLYQMIARFKSSIVFNDRSDNKIYNTNSESIYVFTNVIEYENGVAT